MKAFLAPGGRWIVIDYFRLKPDSKNRSGHLLADFDAAIARHGLAVVERVDVTDNVVPSLAYARVLADRFALPVAHFFSEKFFLRHPFLGYLFQPNVREKLCEGAPRHARPRGVQAREALPAVRAAAEGVANRQEKRPPVGGLSRCGGRGQAASRCSSALRVSRNSRGSRGSSFANSSLCSAISLRQSSRFTAVMRSYCARGNSRPVHCRSS